VIDSCSEGGGAGSGRRLLRFLQWCRAKDPGALGGEALDRAIGVLARVGDLTAMRIVVSDAEKDGRRMAPETFTAVVEALVDAGKEDEAVRLFRGLERQRLLPERGASAGGDGVWSSSLAMVQALCRRGHAREAKGVVWHHKGELSVEPMVSIVERSLLHGWCVHGNAKEARRVLNEMKSSGVSLGLPSFNDFLHCVCHRNLKVQPLCPCSRSYGCANRDEVLRCCPSCF
jgi:TP53 regulating kinase-like protein